MAIARDVQSIARESQLSCKTSQVGISCILRPYSASVLKATDGEFTVPVTCAGVAGSSKSAIHITVGYIVLNEDRTQHLLFSPDNNGARYLPSGLACVWRPQAS